MTRVVFVRGSGSTGTSVFASFVGVESSTKVSSRNQPWSWRCLAHRALLLVLSVCGCSSSRIPLYSALMGRWCSLRAPPAKWPFR
jgi:hypothetical protein